MHGVCPNGVHHCSLAKDMRTTRMPSIAAKYLGFDKKKKNTVRIHFLEKAMVNNLPFALFSYGTISEDFSV
jgi:hypothetical protein